MTVAELLAEIEAELAKAIWLPGEIEVKEATFRDHDPPKDLRSYFGNTEEWNFLVVMWTDGTGLRVDGTATKKRGVIVRFTPKLAKLAGELATK